MVVDLIIVVACISIVSGEDWDGSGLAWMKGEKRGMKGGEERDEGGEERDEGGEERDEGRRMVGRCIVYALSLCGWGLMKSNCLLGDIRDF